MEVSSMPPAPRFVNETDSLNDKYVLDSGNAYMSGIQALARLTLEQTRRDERYGYLTAGFVSGYRGSPLGNFDSALWQIEGLLKQHNVVFQPGVNEDLAATAAWGTQQAHLAGKAKYDGVVAWWYGKGPGVDRSGDALRHANLAGTAARGGVVALYGDDHSCKSSSIPHQSEHVMIGCGIPILYPISVQQILDFGVHAVALSRNAGVWVSMKLVSEIVETSASVRINLDRIQPHLASEALHGGLGLNIRWPDSSLEQEQRLYQRRIPVVLEYARTNGLNRIYWDSPQARVGIAASGKGFLDTIEALRILGLEGSTAQRLGLRVFQVGMIWPLEPQGLREFARGLKEIIVVEEKRPILESQIKDELYSLPDTLRPRVIGKSTESQGEWSTPPEHAPLISHYELQPEPIAKMLAARFLKIDLPDDLRQLIGQKLDALKQAESTARNVIEIAERKAYFCSGCPHNSSTIVPEGSRALGGIGCHFLALSMNRGTETFSQMGGEGVSWAGASHFTNEKHVFANIGDGTYYHSGYLAIRQSVAANVNITYKILYNDAVGMTGGQHVDGPLDVAQMTRQLSAEGVKKISVVTNEPDTLVKLGNLANGVTVHHREELIDVQRDLRDTPGVTALIFAQTCASEKRRRRKRGEFPDPAERAYINTEVCEGCGDCSKKSNCLSVEPVNTALGVKRQINQSSCNKDFSCVDGFCPSFITVNTRNVAQTPAPNRMPDGWPQEPSSADLTRTHRVIVGGVGGTGVVTVGALLGMAAHLEGKAVRVMDMAGMAQKGGTVYSYVQISRADDDIAATKVVAGSCDLLIGADAVVAGSSATLSRMDRNGLALVNEDCTPTAEFIKSRDWTAPVSDLISRLELRVGKDNVLKIAASKIAERMFGDTIFANVMLLGVAWQMGRVPLQRTSLIKAIELNGAAKAKNLEAFRLGCHLAADPSLELRISEEKNPGFGPQTTQQVAQDRAQRLCSYWNSRYAAKYENLVNRASRALPPELVHTIATQLYRLMAYKDEYEVARLLVSDSFRKKIAFTFGGNVRPNYHLAPPAFMGTGRTQKIAFGPWVEMPLRLLARMKGLRETPLDVFSRSDERQKEREWRDRYIELIEQLIASPNVYDLEIATRLARVPEEIRGFGHVKIRAMEIAAKQWTELIAQLRPKNTLV